jgi:hypothetical protein
MPRRDLSLEEQQNVLACLRALRGRFGNWFTLEKALPLAHSQRVEITEGRTEVSTAVAFRIAKLLDVSLYDVLKGTALPKNTCPHCGRARSMGKARMSTRGRSPSRRARALLVGEPPPTERQLEILAFLRAYQESRGAPPALREIGEHFGIASTNGVSDHLRALHRKGLIR